MFVEPLLLRLKQKLTGVKVGGVDSGIEAYVDDVSVWVTSEEELMLLEEIFRQFESFSGAMLNREKKSKILGFGVWKNRKRWPLKWLQSVEEMKIFGFFWMNTFQKMLEKNWEVSCEKLKKCLLGWGARHLPTLKQRVFVLQVFALSIIYYRAHLLPAPPDVVLRVEKMVRRFLWRGWLEKIAFNSIMLKEGKGGLGLVNVGLKLNALQARTMVRLLARGEDDKYRRCLSYLIGFGLRKILPDLARAPNVGSGSPEFLEQIKNVVLELVPDAVCARAMGSLKTKVIYESWMVSDWRPRVEAIVDLSHLRGGWKGVWARSAHHVLDYGPADLLFKLIHGVLPVQDRSVEIVTSPGC